MNQQQKAFDIGHSITHLNMNLLNFDSNLNVNTEVDMDMVMKMNMDPYVGNMTDEYSNRESNFGMGDWNGNDDNSWAGLGYTDIDVAKQFYSLSFQDRNNINEEIHGVKSMACEETPELIEESLMLLAKELQNLPVRYKCIYEMASRMTTKSNKHGEIISSDCSIGSPLPDNCDISNEDHENDSTLLNEDIPPPVKCTNCDDDSSSACYVKSQNFQLAFLRCEQFDSKKAALRLAKFLELAYELYGEEAWRRPLRIDDFKTREEIELFNAGHQQLLPFRDKSGRRVLAVHGDLNLPTSSLMSRSVMSKGPAMKLLLYLWSVLIEDVSAQQKGVVIVFWPRYVDRSIKQSHPQEQGDLDTPEVRSRKKKRGTKKLAKRKKRKYCYSNGWNTDSKNFMIPDGGSRSIGIQFFEAVPIRACAIHLCLPDTPFCRMIRHVAMLIVGHKYRTRVKTHQGVGMEVLYSLRGYGIPVDTLPMDEVTQTIKTKNQTSFAKVRRIIEAEQESLYCCTRNENANRYDSPDNNTDSDESTCSAVSNRSSTIIECPSLNDVIFRSGKSYMSHPGNMTFRGLIEKYIHEHNVATQDKKKSLTWQVVGEVEIKGGRFLEYDRNLQAWAELTNRTQIRHKIATSFKEFRRKIKAYRNTQMAQSSTHKFEGQDGRKRKRSCRGNPSKRKCFPQECLAGLGAEKMTAAV